MIKGLLPQDTRMSEIISGWALLFFSVHIAAFGDIPTALLGLHAPEFWALTLLTSSVLQLASLYLYPAADTLRILMALINGSFWAWIALSLTNEVKSPIVWAPLCIGVANLYGFSIGFLMQRSSWRN